RQPAHGRPAPARRHCPPSAATRCTRATWPPPPAVTTADQTSARSLPPLKMQVDHGAGTSLAKALDRLVDARGQRSRLAVGAGMSGTSRVVGWWTEGDPEPRGHLRAARLRGGPRTNPLWRLQRP